MRPKIHFTAEKGWINDPNGLVYKDGIYHLYFQQNPSGIQWGNISWGHATSRDLLNWTQHETVMYPDKYGMIFSGSGIVNTRSLLNLPKDCLLFFYTAAGGSTKESEGRLFTQRMAYSLDNGETFIKYPDTIIGTIEDENRDPKVFWHEESNAYICVLWLKENDFAILRSSNLKNWEQTQTLTLEDAWECPDLFKLNCDNGDAKWVFWTADGFYFTGTFDGYTFKSDGIRQMAYHTKIPYAAQTYSNVSNRTITIPWLRLKSTAEGYCGAMGIPCELSLTYKDNRYILKQTPVKEYMMSKAAIPNEYESDENPIEAEVNNICNSLLECKYNNILISYNPETGILNISDEQHTLPHKLENFTMLFDGEILEIMANDFTFSAVYELPYIEKSGKIKVICAGADIKLSTIKFAVLKGKL